MSRSVISRCSMPSCTWPNRGQVAWIAGVLRELAHHRHADESLGEGRSAGPSVCRIATSGPHSGKADLFSARGRMESVPYARRKRLDLKSPSVEEALCDQVAMRPVVLGDAREQIRRAHSGAGGGDVARQHESEGAPGWDEGARTNDPQAIGKSRGGWSTKIHRIASDARSAIGFSLSGGEAGDGPQGRTLPKSMNLFPTRTHQPPRRELGMALRRRVCE